MIQSAGLPNEIWPSLPLESWRGTCETLHMWMQIVGKTRLALTPLQNHWWNVPLYVTAHGLGTSAMVCGDDVLDIEFDFLAHVLHLRLGSGKEPPPAAVSCRNRPRPAISIPRKTAPVHQSASGPGIL